jgi:hypothetical protein
MDPKMFATAKGAESFVRKYVAGLNTQYGSLGPTRDGKFCAVAWLRDDQAWMVSTLKERGVLCLSINSKQKSRTQA